MDNNESVLPTLCRKDVLDRIAATATEEQLKRGSLILSEGPVRRGALFDVTGARVPFPDGPHYARCFVALLDPNWRAKWAHDAFWAFVPADGSAEVVICPTDWPPYVNRDGGPVRFQEELVRGTPISGVRG